MNSIILINNLKSKSDNDFTIFQSPINVMVKLPWCKIQWQKVSYATRGQGAIILGFNRWRCRSMPIKKFKNIKQFLRHENTWDRKLRNIGMIFKRMLSKQSTHTHKHTWQHFYNLFVDFELQSCSLNLSYFQQWHLDNAILMLPWQKCGFFCCWNQLLSVIKKNSLCVIKKAKQKPHLWLFLECFACYCGQQNACIQCVGNFENLNS